MLFFLVVFHVEFYFPERRETTKSPNLKHPQILDVSNMRPVSELIVILTGTVSIPKCFLVTLAEKHIVNYFQ